MKYEDRNNPGREDMFFGGRVTEHMSTLGCLFLNSAQLSGDLSPFINEWKIS